MKKSSRLLPPILAIILTVVLTLVLVLHFVSLIEGIPENGDYDVNLYSYVRDNFNRTPAFIIGGCGFISLLISVKWLIETIFAIKSKD